MLNVTTFSTRNVTMQNVTTQFFKEKSNLVLSRDPPDNVMSRCKWTFHWRLLRKRILRSNLRDFSKTLGSRKKVLPFLHGSSCLKVLQSYIQFKSEVPISLFSERKTITVCWFKFAQQLDAGLRS